LILLLFRLILLLIQFRFDSFLFYLILLVIFQFNAFDYRERKTVEN